MSRREGRGEGRRGVWGWYAYAVTRLRWIVVIGWVMTAAGSVLWLPPFGSGGEKLSGFDAESPAVASEIRSFELFGFPLSSRVVIVQHDPEGLSPNAQVEAVLRAGGITQGAYETRILGAIPVPNTNEVFPGAREDSTAVLTYVLSDPRTGFQTQTRRAEEFAGEHLQDPDDAYVGVAGSIPARAAQVKVVEENLHLVEAATLGAVLLVVALTFRSLVAPGVALAAAGVAVTTTLGVVGYVAKAVGASVPGDLQPLIVALLLGVVTDYVIIFLSGLRTNVRDGLGRVEAAEKTTRDLAPIVTVAGVTVAAGTASLIVAESALFRGFGPGMGLTVLVGLVVAVTLIPALMAILGGRALWPAPMEKEERAEPSRLTRTVTSRRGAGATLLIAIGGLTLLALPLQGIGLGLSFTQSLPKDDPVAVAAAAAEEGFAPGILSPTEILVEGDIRNQRREIREFERLVQAQEGVAGVLGPDDAPIAGEYGIVTTADGGAARMLVIFDTPPLGAEAIDDFRGLRDSSQELQAEAGLEDVQITFGGDTALSAGVVKETTDDLLRISLAALAVNLVMLIVFLRAVLAPLYLLACSVLGLLAALGATTYVFQDILGHPGITFYVPFAAAVLLVSLGSDYNIFAVGHVWQKAERLRLREAMRESIPETTKAITSAGIALAASFGLLALVPLQPFRELGFALAAGILIDVLVVRSLLVPALLTLVGPVSGWPGKRLRDPDAEANGTLSSESDEADEHLDEEPASAR